MSEYRKYRRLAKRKGWPTDQYDDYFSTEVWLHYWKSKERSEKHPEEGRPVPPHRPA